MICNKIRDILLSDYFDHESTHQERQLVKEHLAQCNACRSLEQRLQAQRYLWQKIEKKDPPVSVWNNIQAAIVDEQSSRSESIADRAISFLGALLTARPVFALGSVFAAILCIAVFTTGVVRHQQAAGRGENLASLSGYSMNLESSDVVSDFGTDIERFLL